MRYHKGTVGQEVTQLAQGLREASEIQWPHLPVRIDWSTLRVVDLMEVNLISAGTLSPTNWGGKKAAKVRTLAIMLHRDEFVSK